MQTISLHESYEIYNNMLNDCYEEISICGLEYEPSRALKEVDPVAYQCGHNDYFSGEDMCEEFEIEGC